MGSFNKNYKDAFDMITNRVNYKEIKSENKKL